MQKEFTTQFHGTVQIDTSYQNNIFVVYKYSGQRDCIGTFYIDESSGEFCQNTYNNTRVKLPEQEIEEFKEIIYNDFEYFRPRIKKWATDCIKRLDKSIPRLELELEQAKKKHETLSVLKTYFSL